MSAMARFARRVAGLLCMAALASPAHADFIVFDVGGTSSASSIDATVDAFRAALGDPNNGNLAGPLPDGRREINWDGGGTPTPSASGTPFLAFTDSRGATFTTPGTGFLQTPVDSLALTDINPTYADIFSVFSPLRVFTPLGSNITDITFFIPGSDGALPATVSGFGAVFTDVDLADVTSLQLFDAGLNLLATFFVSPGLEADGSLSFLGILADAGEQIARVRITTGNAALGPVDGDLVDVVAMDDFLYSEPAQIRAIPEPTSLMLVLLALIGAVSLRARKP
jgi:hypothetical protein